MHSNTVIHLRQGMVCSLCSILRRKALRPWLCTALCTVRSQSGKREQVLPRLAAGPYTARLDTCGGFSSLESCHGQVSALELPVNSYMLLKSKQSFSTLCTLSFYPVEMILRSKGPFLQPQEPSLA